MVARCDRNYPQHKIDIYNTIEKKYGSGLARKFIDFYSSRYDKFNRSFIDYRLAFWLTDDYYYTKRVGTKWYGIVGIGGTGKTTLAKNILYYLDPTFDLDRIFVDMPSFVEKLDELPKTNSMKAICLDEPDDDIFAHSHLGKILRKVIGKSRQQNLFIGMCATDLKDIPTYIFRRLDGIFFCQSLGHYMFFKNKPQHGSYVIQQIRNEYAKQGYRIFYKLQNSIGCLRGDTTHRVPFTIEQEQEYLKNKVTDYKKNISDFINFQKKQANGNGDSMANAASRIKTIMDLKEKKKTDLEIAHIIGLSRGRINEIIREHRISCDGDGESYTL